LANVLGFADFGLLAARDAGFLEAVDFGFAEGFDFFETFGFVVFNLIVVPFFVLDAAVFLVEADFFFRGSAFDLPAVLGFFFGALFLAVEGFLLA
jgi:hypothetical protein